MAKATGAATGEGSPRENRLRILNGYRQTVDQPLLCLSQDEARTVLAMRRMNPLFRPAVRVMAESLADINPKIRAIKVIVIVVITSHHWNPLSALVS